MNKNNVPERGVNQFLSLVPSSMLDYRGRKNGGEFTFFMRHLYATLRDKSIKCVFINQRLEFVGLQKVLEKH